MSNSVSHLTLHSLNINRPRHLRSLSDSSSMRKRPLSEPSITCNNKVNLKEFHRHMELVISNNTTSKLLIPRILVLSKQRRKSINILKTVNLLFSLLNKHHPLTNRHRKRILLSSNIPSLIQQQLHATTFIVDQK